MNKEIWLKRIDRIARLEKKSKWVRLLSNPVNRIYGLTFSKLIFPSSKKLNYTSAHLVFDYRMTVALPDGLDIFLCGCKTHDSELRFAKWMIQTLQPRDTFFDVGAHFGFFSLLAAQLVKESGKVISFEPAALAANILHNNIERLRQVRMVQAAVGETTGSVMFLEGKPGQTESSGRMSAEEEENETIQGNLVNCVSLDDFSEKEKLFPTAIKIDAEGSELKVLQGMNRLLHSHKPAIIMEFWSKQFHNNQQHIDAMNLLISNGYTMNLIDDDGKLFRSNNPEQLCMERKLESDNIVFTA